MSTTENAADCTTHAIEQLARIIATCGVFQESIPAVDEETAREHVHKSYYRIAEGEAETPYANIFESAGTRWVRQSDGTQLPMGELFLHLCIGMESDDDPEGEERRVNNWHGQIAAEISSYNGAGYKMLTVMTDPPSRTHPADQGSTQNVWEVGYTVSWSCF
jgi:hypothetical protein